MISFEIIDDDRFPNWKPATEQAEALKKVLSDFGCAFEIGNPYTVNFVNSLQHRINVTVARPKGIRWERIYQANRSGLLSKDQLKVGQQLLIP